MIGPELGGPAHEELNTRLRLLTWEDYGITDDRYRELKYFCLQYPDKRKIADGSTGEYGLHGVRYDGGGSGSKGEYTGPTESSAIRNAARSEKARRDCRMIEEAARWAAQAGGYPGSAPAILASVTKGTNYDGLLPWYEVPFGKTDFYAVRRAFYHRLDELQEAYHEKLHGGRDREKSEK